MPTISKLSVILSAEAGQFLHGLKEAEAETTSFQERLSQAGEKVSGALEAIGITLSAEAFGEWIHGAMEMAEKTEHLADSLGMTTEAMSRLGFAGKMVDVSQEEIGQAMARMSKSLYEAQSGSSEAAKALGDMGLSAGALMSMAPDAAFAKLADAIDGVNSPMQRLADAQAIFGRGAIALMPLLEKGSAGLKEMADESDRLGYTLGGADAKQLEEANESIKRLQASMQGIANQMAIDLAPSIKGVTDNASGLMDIFRGTEVVVDGLRGSIAYLLRGLLEVPREIGFIGEKISHALGAHDAEAKYAELKGFVDGIGQAGTEAFKSAGDAIDKMGSSASHAGAASHSAAEAAGHHAGQLGELGQAAENTAKRIDSMLESLRVEAAMFGASDAQKKISELANAGASSDQLAQAHGYADLLDQMRQQKKLSDAIAEDDRKNADAMMTDLQRLEEKWRKLGMSAQQATDQALKDLKAKFDQDQKQQAEKVQNDLKKQAESIFEATRTPLEKLQERAEMLKKLFSQGLIDIPTMQRDLAKAVGEVDKVKEKLGPSPLANTFEAGSSGAARYIAEYNMGMGADTKDDRAIEQQKQANSIAQQILKAIENQKPVEVFQVASF